MASFSSSSGSATTLSYTYTGNRLSSIGSSSYVYDVNGNLITDGRRGLSLTYNLLGRTANVSSGGTAKASYTYLSDGSLFEVANGSDGYRYLGSFIYNRNSSLESVAFGGGRIFKNGGSYSVDYHISDHLGSIRAIVRNGSVIEQNDYYPFGSRQDNGLPVQTSPTANRFRFNGKELQSTDSLGYLNYGARFYDPDIARWNACDVLADVQNGLSPYSFCGGNPILNVDGDGNIFETAWDAVSLVMGVKSFVGNVRQGNAGAAILDGVGIVGDALSVAAPFVPGGLSVGIAAARIAKNADNVVDAVKAADKAVDAAQGLDNTVGIIDAPKVFSTNKAITKGETFHTALGRKAHNDYNPGEGFIKEYRLPSHKRADAVNEEMGIVKELKPNNKRAIKKG